MIKILTTLFSWSRRLHRLSLFAASFLTLGMGISGLALKYVWAARFLRMDPGLVRFLHNQLSPYFAVLLGVMMVSGLYMYLHPPLVNLIRRVFYRPVQSAPNTATV